MTLSVYQMLDHVTVHGGVTPEEKDRLARYCLLKHNRDIWAEALQYRPPVRTGDRYS